VEDKKPVASVRINLELEAVYDSFNGRTLAEFAELLDEELHECLNDFREEDVIGIFSKVESVNIVTE
tara:strand:+ start:8945 stop:9145 length:201 start_codon:yes stop_codon:yes gene_type:complete